MKVVFLCGTCEAGKDGVGDYTRRLAGQLIKMGHACMIVSLMDKFVSENISDHANPTSENVSFLRLSYINGIKANCKTAAVAIQGYNPGWISLQFVPFSFHNKGLPFALGRQLKFLSRTYRVQIMFHELWVLKTGFKSAILKSLQMLIVKGLVRNLRPRVIHTQTALYKYNLASIGIQSSHLPLFSNIPCVQVDKKTVEPKEHQCVFVSFGGLYPDSNISLFSEAIARYSKQYKIHCRLIIMGRTGDNVNEWRDAWTGNGLELEVLGETHTDKICEIFDSSSFGIVSTPMALIEKSGTFAAMRDFGLPVICISKAWCPKGGLINQDPNVFEFLKGDIEGFLNNAHKHPPKDSLSMIAKQFERELVDAI